MDLAAFNRSMHCITKYGLFHFFTFLAASIVLGTVISGEMLMDSGTGSGRLWWIEWLYWLLTLPLNLVIRERADLTVFSDFPVWMYVINSTIVGALVWSIGRVLNRTAAGSARLAGTLAVAEKMPLLFVLYLVLFGTPFIFDLPAAPGPFDFQIAARAPAIPGVVPVSEKTGVYAGAVDALIPGSRAWVDRRCYLSAVEAESMTPRRAAQDISAVLAGLRLRDAELINVLAGRYWVLRRLLRQGSMLPPHRLNDVRACALLRLGYYGPGARIAADEVAELYVRTRPPMPEILNLLASWRPLPRNATAQLIRGLVDNRDYGLIKLLTAEYEVTVEVLENEFDRPPVPERFYVLLDLIRSLSSRGFRVSSALAERIAGNDQQRRRLLAPLMGLEPDRPVELPPPGGAADQGGPAKERAKYD